MVSEKEKYEDYYDCPYTTAMKVIGGKWKVVIIGHLMEGEKRSSALKRLIPGVTQKMFTQQLRNWKLMELSIEKFIKKYLQRWNTV